MGAKNITGPALEYSRVVRIAEHLGVDAADIHRFTEKSVLLTGDIEFLSTPAGRLIALFTLRFLVRICRNVTVLLPEVGREQLLPDGLRRISSLAAELKAEAEHIAFAAPVLFDSEAKIAEFDATLSIGYRTDPQLPITVVNTRNWVAFVSSSGREIPAGTGVANPVSAMGAAALATGEVFKRLISLNPSRGTYLDRVSFSFYDYRSGDEIVDEGPTLSGMVLLDLLLVGCGAIGNGILGILAEFVSDGRVSGRINVVDNQAYQPENLGTCLLIGPHEIEAKIPKAEFAEGFLRASLRKSPSNGESLTVHGYVKRIEDFARAMKDEDAPAIIVNALDNIEARRSSQAIWPDLMIDGAIGESMCQVSRHSGSGQEACVRCLFRTEVIGSAASATAEETGLALPRVSQHDDVITEVDVQTAPEGKQEFLRSKLGRKIGEVICARMSERAARNLSEEDPVDGFEPSVPFVACLASTMVCSELIKSAFGLPTALDCRFQFDFLWGPGNGLMFPEIARQDCDCVTRAKNIQRLRQLRRKNRRLS